MNKIKRYINSQRDKIVADLVELVRIPSIADTQGAIDVMERVAELFSQAGAEIYRGKSYTLATMVGGAHKIGLFAHGDVVPPGEGWTMCNPFEGKIIEGDIFGRGAWDDKSAVVISLYAFKIIKELGLDFNSTLVVFVGANEETTMEDIVEYKKDHAEPHVSMVLDAAFPIYLGDKGMLWLECQKAAWLEDLLELTGGEAINITLKCAKARVRYSRELFEELIATSNLDVCREGDEIIINAEGISAHGANPQGTVNAGGMILKALLECEHFNKGDKEKLRLLTALLSSYDGSTLGIASYDELFGVTTATNGIINICNGSIKFTLDVRYGSTYNEESLTKALAKVLGADGIRYNAVKKGEPKAISPQNKYVMACIEAYKSHTGEENPTPRINAGGTYSRFLENAFEIGTTMKYSRITLPSGHGGAHQPDEHISIDGLLEAIEMVVEMILACDKP